MVVVQQLAFPIRIRSHTYVEALPPKSWTPPAIFSRFQYIIRTLFFWIEATPLNLRLLPCTTFNLTLVKLQATLFLIETTSTLSSTHKVWGFSYTI